MSEYTDNNIYISSSTANLTTVGLKKFKTSAGDGDITHTVLTSHAVRHGYTLSSSLRSYFFVLSFTA